MSWDGYLWTGGYSHAREQYQCTAQKWRDGDRPPRACKAHGHLDLAGTGRGGWHRGLLRDVQARTGSRVFKHSQYFALRPLKPKKSTLLNLPDELKVAIATVLASDVLDVEDVCKACRYGETSKCWCGAQHISPCLGKFRLACRDLARVGAVAMKDLAESHRHPIQFLNLPGAQLSMRDTYQALNQPNTQLRECIKYIRIEVLPIYREDWEDRAIDIGCSIELISAYRKEQDKQEAWLCRELIHPNRLIWLRKIIASLHPNVRIVFDMPYKLKLHQPTELTAFFRNIQSTELYPQQPLIHILKPLAAVASSSTPRPGLQRLDFRALTGLLPSLAWYPETMPLEILHLTHKLRTIDLAFDDFSLTAAQKWQSLLKTCHQLTTLRLYPHPTLSKSRSIAIDPRNLRFDNSHLTFLERLFGSPSTGLTLTRLHTLELLNLVSISLLPGAAPIHPIPSILLRHSATLKDFRLLQFALLPMANWDIAYADVCSSFPSRGERCTIPEPTYLYKTRKLVPRVIPRPDPQPSCIVEREVRPEHGETVAERTVWDLREGVEFEVRASHPLFRKGKVDKRGIWDLGPCVLAAAKRRREAELGL